MQLSLIIKCNLHAAVSDVRAINIWISRMKNPSKNLVLEVLLLKENPENVRVGQNREMLIEYAIAELLEGG